MQLYSADTTMFFFFFKWKTFWPPIVEKTTHKSCSEFLKSTFYPYCPDYQTAEEEFMFQNVAYWPVTLYIELG